MGSLGVRERGPPTMIQHLLELLAYYRRASLWILLGTTGGTLLCSLALLFAMPSYKGAASIVMMPSDPQLAFSSDITSGQGSVESLSGTHMEYLKSGPVTEAVLDRILEEIPMEEGAGGGGFKATLKDTLRDAMGFLRRTYRTANSGTYVEPEMRDTLLSLLREGIRVEGIPGSYVLRIEATLPDPDAAALAANLLAEAYMDVWKAELETSVSEWGSFFDARIADAEARLEEAILHEFQVKQELGVLSVEEERAYLMKAREAERGKHADARTRAEALEAELAQLQGSGDGGLTRSSTLTTLADRVVLGAAERAGLIEEERVRAELVAQLGQELDATHEHDAVLEKLAEARASLEAELEDLRQRKLLVELSRASYTDQIRMIDPARVPVYPASPEVFDYTVFGFLAGLMLVVAFLLTCDHLSPSVKTSAELARVLEEAGDGPPPFAGRLELGGGKGRQRRRERLGRELDRVLAASGTDAALAVTGFGDPKQIDAGTAALAGVLGAGRVDGRGALGAGFRWDPEETAPVLCLVEAGASGGEEIREFRRTAEVSGRDALFLLVV